MKSSCLVLRHWIFIALVSGRQILLLSATLSYCKISFNNDKHFEATECEDCLKHSVSFEKYFHLTVLARKTFAVALCRYL